MPNVYQFKDFEGSSHRILIDLARRFAPRGGRLLDLGAAGGELGSAVRPLFSETFGFEFDVERIAQLRPRFDHVVIADLDRVPVLPPADVIVMADVLEHLRFPQQILSQVHAALDDQGLLFLSVPNIANITIRIGLFFGIFRYRERGILDETHLRFYTRTTIQEELERAGFQITAVRGSSVPIRLIIDGWAPEIVIRAGERVLTWCTAVWKALMAYQIILVAKKG